MRRRLRQPGEVLRHARYVVWAAKALAAAGRDWRRRPGAGSSCPLTGPGLHGHLTAWAVAGGVIAAPPDPPREPPSYYAALAFDREPERTKREARRYWRAVVRERLCTTR